MKEHYRLIERQISSGDDFEVVIDSLPRNTSCSFLLFAGMIDRLRIREAMAYDRCSFRVLELLSRKITIRI